MSSGVDRLAQAIAERLVALIVDSLDVDAIVKRIDVDDIVRRIDVDAIVQRIDVDAIAQRIDVDAIVENTELSSIISRSTTGVLTEFLNLLRSQIIRIDDSFESLLAAVTGREHRPLQPDSPSPRGQAS
ncbi:MAG: hypothetical protein NT160_09125 [Actinobacteria bacterium]|nr:hypothetical protein [Actinomycetota bacterium]